MRISLQMWGSDGDIRPFIALAGGLRAAGHAVTIAVASVDNKDYGQRCKALNVEYVKVPEQIDCDRNELIKKAKGKKSIDFLKLIMLGLYYPCQDQMYQTAGSLRNARFRSLATASGPARRRRYLRERVA
jgi:sterol 3beta-glucosyltransferase